MELQMSIISVSTAATRQMRRALHRLNDVIKANSILWTGTHLSEPEIGSNFG